MKLSRRIRRSWQRHIPEWMKCFSTIKSRVKNVQAQIRKRCRQAIGSITKGLRAHTREWSAALLAAGLIVSPYTIDCPEKFQISNFKFQVCSAMPQDAQVVGGQADVKINGDVMNINQTTVRAAIDWQSFDIAKNETVNIYQPNAQAVALNRILGSNATEIYGHLNANGQVYLSNPNGILFARGSEINVAGLIATTSHIDAQAFMRDGTISATERNAAIINSGSIFASGGLVSISGATAINNDGIIRAGSMTNQGGVVVLGAARMIENHGTIEAAGGSVTISAVQADSDTHGVIMQGGTVSVAGNAGGTIALSAENGLIDNSGNINAGGTSHAGDITLAAKAISMVTNATITADSAGGSGGSINLLADSQILSGTLSADGRMGGEINILGRDLYLFAPGISADGTAARGGSIRIGGGWQGGGGYAIADNNYVGTNTTISASGATGGQVTIWSNINTRFAGSITATGAANHGGAIEVSGKGDISYSGTANPGSGGVLLFDPKNIVVTDAAAGGGFGTILSPDGSSAGNFGEQLYTIGNAYLAIVDGTCSKQATSAGAVYLFSTTDYSLRGALYGSNAGDQVGDGAINPSSGAPMGVQLLNNNSNNFLVNSPYWSGGAGAVTFVNPALAQGSAILSSANSLVGTTSGDNVGASGATLLLNGNYVVLSPNWTNADYAATNAGAVTWGSSISGVCGEISAANSLVGTQANDVVGSDGIVQTDEYNPGNILSNANYLVLSTAWRDYRGAVTWASGTSGVRGEVSSSNSLVGTNPYDAEDLNVSILPNGNYVVVSPSWNGGSANGMGAVTWASGVSGISGEVSSANSLVGTTAQDFVGSDGITILTNSNYVVVSSGWSNGTEAKAGAVTWASGTSGVSGAVSSSNSLVGSTSGDEVGVYENNNNVPQNNVIPLANGNYVVGSPYWTNGTVGYAGAVTWGNGARGGVTGTINASNSLVGTNYDDCIGLTYDGEHWVSGIITQDYYGNKVGNGNYIVVSANWNYDSDNEISAGAVTWGSGTSGVSGVLSSANSLVGKPGDRIGDDGRGGVYILSNGNYVVNSPHWSIDSSTTEVGAVTWGSGTSGVQGEVSPGNSLTGAHGNSAVGSDGITQLANGNYVVLSNNWSEDGTYVLGAATWLNGAVATSGIVSFTNSLIGAYPGDFSNASVRLLANSNYVVILPSWSNNDVAVDAGAVTWGSGTTGVAGEANSINSLVGSQAYDYVGSLVNYRGSGNPATFSVMSGVTVLSNGDYVVASNNWSYDSSVNAAKGAVTWGSGVSGVKGVVASGNSLVGSTAGDNVGEYSNGQIYNGVTDIGNGNYAVASNSWNSAAGAVTWGSSANSGVHGVISSANSLVGSTASDQVGGGGDGYTTRGVTVLSNGNYVVLSPNWSYDSDAAMGKGAVTWGSGTSGVVGEVSSVNSLVGTVTSDNVGSGGLTLLANGNYVVMSPNWNNYAGAVTWGNGTSGVVGEVSSVNSLVGSTGGDYVGVSGIVKLTNGNYIVVDSNWSDGSATAVGAVTWGNGWSGVSGAISSTNSLVGTTSGDAVGLNGIVETSNGDYVVLSSSWNNATTASAGAATWGSGISGIRGAVSSANSIVGTLVNEQVGSNNANLVVSNNSVYILKPAENMVQYFAPHSAATKGVIASPDTENANSFGAATTVINTAAGGSYLVVTDPNYSNIATNAGAVYVISTSGGVLQGAIYGNYANDAIASNGITQLLGKEDQRGNFLISSSAWNANRGAVTFVNPAAFSGSLTISSANSLVGSTGSDQVGLQPVTALSNGNYLVSNTNWSNGAATAAGAVTWGSGVTGVSGVVSSVNSLVGTSANDTVGSTVRELSDGNYIVASNQWDNGTGAANAGAVTWGDGTTGVSGNVSSANSLVGSHVGDQVGNQLKTLQGGGYLVLSGMWKDSSAVAVGAATWGSAERGVSGVISSSNSLIGSRASDMLNPDSYDLGNGNFVVTSYNWNNNGTAVAAGAVTWGSGISGVHGVISSANSLVGTHANDYVGLNGILVLNNGNYLVESNRWNANAGAVTWGNGMNGVRGAVSSANSLVGSTANDRVGQQFGLDGFLHNGITQTANGNYIVTSSQWDNGSVANAGAVTWGSGTSGIAGEVSSANSLVGTTANDYLGAGGITLLANGNYVVDSPYWNVNAGAVTWGNGMSGVRGAVSSANSLVGTIAGDNVGEYMSYDGDGSTYSSGVVALGNGSYTVVSSGWSNGGAIAAGAVTWGNGASGVSGAVSTTNSLVGTSERDRVGTIWNPGTNQWYAAVFELANGNYVVASNQWMNGGAALAGAATWMNGSSGLTSQGTAGAITSANSLVGGSAFDMVGVFGVTALASGNYVVNSPFWNSQVGAVTWGDGRNGAQGVVSSANSLVGAAAEDRIGARGVKALADGNYLVTSSDWNGSTGAVTWGDGASGITGVVASTNSLVGAHYGDAIGNSITELSNGNYVVISSDWSNGITPYAGAVTWGNGLSGIKGVVSSVNSLVGATEYDYAGSLGVFELNDGNYYVRSGLANSNGAVTWGSGVAGIVGAVSTANSIVGTIPGGQSSWNVTTNNGTIYVGMPMENQVQYLAPAMATGGGVSTSIADCSPYTNNAGATLTLATVTLTDALNSGATVLLQATNDITFQSGWTATAGTLTAEAGRNIAINNALVDLGSTFTFTANADAAAAAGNRDSGRGGFSMAGGSLDVGSGTVNINVESNSLGTIGSVALAALSAGTLNIAMANGGQSVTQSAALAVTTATTINAAGNAIILGNPDNSFGNLSAQGTLVIIAAGDAPLKIATVNGSDFVNINDNSGVTINAGGSVTSTAVAPYAALVINAGTGNFINLGGASALQAATSSWQVYSADPANDTRGGLVYDFKQYNATYGTTVLGTGNGFLYALAPTVTFSLGGTTTKVYDNNVNVTNFGAITANVTAGIVDNDTNVAVAVTAADFDNKDAATSGKIVTATASAITAQSATGKPVYGYSASTAPGNGQGAIGAITPLALTASGEAATNKVYDHSTTANLTGTTVLTGVLGADDVTVNSPSTGTFDNWNANNGKTVTIGGLALSGADAVNYTVGDYTTTANITPLALTAAGETAISRVYDRDFVAELSGTTTLTGVLGADDVAVNSPTTGLFVDRNVATDIPVIVYGLALSGTNAGNYTVNNAYIIAGNITPLAITAAGEAATSKVYDRSTTANLTGTTVLTGVIAGDTVTVNSPATGAFADWNAENGKIVTVSGLALGGAASGNYTVNSSYTTTADITKFMLAVSAAGVDRTYNATTTATVTLSDDRFDGDSFTDSYSSAVFDSKDVASGKVVLVSGIEISGADAANYNFNTVAATTADIAPASLTVSATGINRMYNGTTAATVTLSDDRFGGDVFIDAYGSAAFTSATVGTNKMVDVAGISINGADAANYVCNTTATTTASITPAADAEASRQAAIDSGINQGDQSQNTTSSKQQRSSQSVVPSNTSSVTGTNSGGNTVTLGTSVPNSTASVNGIYANIPVDTIITMPAPTDAAGFYSRALAYSAAGRTDLALADYTAAVRTNPALLATLSPDIQAAVKQQLAVSK